MRLFFFVHNSNVSSQMALLAELLKTLVTLVWLDFVVHMQILNVSSQMALPIELLQVLATLIRLLLCTLLMCLFRVTLVVNVMLQSLKSQSNDFVSSL